MVIFALWVVSPFVVLGLSNALSKHWSSLTRMAVYSVSLVIAVVTLAIYAEVAFGPPRAKTATLFVIVPPASWLAIATVVPIAALISRRSARHLSKRGDAQRGPAPI
jgi:hypothetical protein